MRNAMWESFYALMDVRSYFLVGKDIESSLCHTKSEAGKIG